MLGPSPPSPSPHVQGVAPAATRRGRPLARHLAGRPAELVLYLDRDQAGGVPGPAEVAWRDVVVDAVAWLGPVPVTLLVAGAVLPPHLAVATCARRLGCPVSLATAGLALDEDLARELVCAGVGEVRVVVDRLRGGMAGPASSVGVRAVETLLATGPRRPRVLAVAPLDPQVLDQFGALAGWARQVGADGFSLAFPACGRGCGAEAVQEAVRRLRPLLARGGHPLGSGAGLLAALRRVASGRPACPPRRGWLDVRADGRVQVRPGAGDPQPFAAPGDLRRVWVARPTSGRGATCTAVAGCAWAPPGPVPLVSIT